MTVFSPRVAVMPRDKRAAEGNSNRGAVVHRRQQQGGDLFDAKNERAFEAWLRSMVFKDAPAVAVAQPDPVVVPGHAMAAGGCPAGAVPPACHLVLD